MPTTLLKAKGSNEVFFQGMREGVILEEEHLLQVSACLSQHQAFCDWGTQNISEPYWQPVVFGYLAHTLTSGISIHWLPSVSSPPSFPKKGICTEKVWKHLNWCIKRKVNLAFVEDQFRGKCLFSLEIRSYWIKVITGSTGLLQQD